MISAGCNKKSTDGLHDAFAEFDTDNCEIYQQLKLGAVLYVESLSSQIGYYFLLYTSIGIAIISILRVVNLKAFLTAKREYEEIITKEFQQLP